MQSMQSMQSMQAKFIPPENLASFLKNPAAMCEFAIATRNFMCASAGFTDKEYLHFVELQFLNTVNTLLRKNLNNLQHSDDSFQQLAKQLIQPFLQQEQNKKFMERLFIKVMSHYKSNQFTALLLHHNTALAHDAFLETHVYAHIVNAQGYSGFVPCPEYDEAIDGNPVSFKSKLLSGVYRVPYTEQKAKAITWDNGTEKDIRKVHYATGVNKVH